MSNVENIVLGLIGLIFPFLCKNISKNISKNRVSSRKYLEFKSIRKEYEVNKINGYFAFQNFLKRRFEKEVIDYILESPDAYTIINILKMYNISFDFKDKVFITNITKWNFVLPILLYFLFSLPLVWYFSYSIDIIKQRGLHYFLVYALIFCLLFLPLVILCYQKINSLAKARFLGKITSNSQDKKLRCNSIKIKFKIKIF